MLPTAAFETVDDVGELVIEHGGRDICIPNLATARLVDGTKKLVRYISENDDVEAFIFPDGRELVL
jgi:hypothetical protein